MGHAYALAKTVGARLVEEKEGEEGREGAVGVNRIGIHSLYTGKELSENKEKRS